MKAEAMITDKPLGHRLGMSAWLTDFLDLFLSDFFDVIVCATKMYADMKFGDLQFCKGWALLLALLGLKILKKINKVWKRRWSCVTNLFNWNSGFKNNFFK